MKRSRGRNRRSGGNPQNAFNNPNRHYESVGPDVKIRGSAQQVLEKYQQYARDAHTSGDRELSEAYHQYAEHYQRIVAKQLEARGGQPQNPNQNQNQNPNQNQNRGNNGNGNGYGRDDRDGRPNGDRDGRNETSDDNSGTAETSGNDSGEAVVTPHQPPPRRRTDEDNAPDTLRVIDAEPEEEDDASDTVEAQSDEGDSESEGERDRAPRTRRKPYRARAGKDEAPGAEADAVAPETEGVMKTLSRGRRRPVVAEDAPTETTD